MVVVSILPHAEFGPHDHRGDAPHFRISPLVNNNDTIFRLSSTRIEPNKKVQLKEGKTAVSALQELLQKRGASIPTYKEKGGSGPPFTIYCHVDELISEATGNSKKEAKHKAAENMLIKLQDDVNRAPGIG